MSAIHEEGIQQSGGRVAFVGAGPGDASLLTLAAINVLASADLVLAACPDLAAMLDDADLQLQDNARVEVVELGEPWPDEAARLVADGALVARLVCEDPLMDHRTAEEAATCRASGLQIEIVPGIPRLTAIPEYAGIALRPNEGVQLISIHGQDPLVRFAPTGTVVVSALASRLDDVIAAALDAGRPPSSPITVTVNGATVRQASTTTTLGELTKPNSKRPPADEQVVVVVGGGEWGVDQPEDLDWFETKPLFGWRVLVPRTKDPVDGLITRLHTYGAECVEVPTMSVEPPRSPQQLERAVQGLVEGRYGWTIFTSPASVGAIRERFEELGLDTRAFSGLKLAAVGVGTSEALHAWGLIPDLVPHSGASVIDLAAEFPAYDDLIDPINRVFVPRADTATEALADGLVELGWEVEEVVAVRTVRAAPPTADIREAIKSGDFDAVCFVSSSAARNLVGIAGKPHALTVVAAIGPATAATCAEHGLAVSATARVTTQVSLADALALFAADREADLVARGQKVLRPSQRRRARRKAS